MTNKELLEFVNRKRLWMTSQECLAELEARKAAVLKKRQQCSIPNQPGPSVREYRLDLDLQWTPEAKALMAQKPEVEL